MITRRQNGYLHTLHPEALNVLFLAPYAPDAPDYQSKRYSDDGSYPEYHAQVFTRLRRLGFMVHSSSKPYSIVHASSHIDYVFSLYNRIPIRNSEVFVSTYCEYLGVPYMGAPPNVRAAAEDKYISKLVAAAAGIPTPKGVPYIRGVTTLSPAPFRGPYFVKNRFGAASEDISPDNLQETWEGAVRIIREVWDRDTDAIVEEYIDGIDITGPVIGDDTPRLLGLYEPVSDKRGRILTHDLKLTDHLGYRRVDASHLQQEVTHDMLALWAVLGPIDYFRLDYRFDPASGARLFLELNICCYIGEQGPFGMGALNDGGTIDDLVDHAIAFSLSRQSRLQKHRQRVL